MNLNLVIGLCLVASFGFDYIISTHVSSLYVDLLDEWFAGVTIILKLIFIPLSIIYEGLAIKALCTSFTDGKKTPEQFDLSMAVIIFRMVIEVHIMRAMTGFLMDY